MALKEEGKDFVEGCIVSRFRDMSKDDKIALVASLLDELKRLHGVGVQELAAGKEIAVPAGIFANDALSSLEAAVKYLKEDRGMKFARIARLLNRSSKTVWATYSKAISKMSSSFGDVPKHIMIPASAFANRSFSMLESVVMFIKDLGYSNHETAEMLHLDDRTIWTVYDRVKKKRGIKVD